MDDIRMNSPEGKALGEAFPDIAIQHLFDNNGQLNIFGQIAAELVRFRKLINGKPIFLYDNGDLAIIIAKFPGFETAFSQKRQLTIDFLKSHGINDAYIAPQPTLPT